MLDFGVLAATALPDIRKRDVVQTRKIMNRCIGTFAAERPVPAGAPSLGWGLRTEAESRRSG